MSQRFVTDYFSIYDKSKFDQDDDNSDDQHSDDEIDYPPELNEDYISDSDIYQKMRLVMKIWRLNFNILAQIFHSKIL